MSESIYNLIPYEVQVREKNPIPYTSKPAQQVVPNSTFGCYGTSRLPGAGQITRRDGALFGSPKPDSGLPRTNTLRNSGSFSLSPDRYGEFAYTDRRKATVPSKDEKPISGISTNKNFVTANAVEAILMVPKKTGGKELNYMKKEDFGKVPSYLTQVKDEIRRENEMIERYVKHQMGEVEQTPETFEAMDDYERDELLAQLKEKWEHTNAIYQKQTHLVKLDTTGQLRRKETLEQLLTQLEQDIDRLERSREVLIRK